MKFVYAFNEGSAELKSKLGGKGANLAEMMRIGLPVPDGFTLTTDACQSYYDNEEQLSSDILQEVQSHLASLEEKTGKTFGDPNNPLLVSVRSGAVISMPGMMDTVLNLGLNDEVTAGFGALTSNPRFAYDSYRRFIQMYGDVVLGIQKYHFDRVLTAEKDAHGIDADIDLTVDMLQSIIASYKEVVLKETGEAFPTDPQTQLHKAICAVFASWQNSRAKIYRQINGISDALGTAVNVQSMVYGNMGNDSGTGVAFTRNPSTGESALFGEFLMNAQGEDVVAGIRTPQHIQTLGDTMPDVYKEFVNVTHILEKHYKDMQDIEFTIERGKLFLLQTRTGKRTAKAAVELAVTFEKEGLIDKQTAINRIDPAQIDQLLHPTFNAEALESAEAITQGLPASPGAASGEIYFNAHDVKQAASEGKKAILVRMETSPEDIEGMVLAEGILTARGGMTSHAAVVARGMGKCCVSGCGDIRVDEHLRQFTVNGTVFKEGDTVSLDGNTGKVYCGIIPVTEVALSANFKTLLSWADNIRTLGVRTNADTPKDAKIAVEFGAEGIGLCRTEHMFFDASRIMHVREMILATNIEERLAALDKLLPYQREDFIGIFEAMDGKPVTVRLLDPPLHEFLPQTDEEIDALAESLCVAPARLKQRKDALAEVNPMLGHRGCRLAITYPEIYQMQVTAISEAIVACLDKGITVETEIMIPLVGKREELSQLRMLVIKTIESVQDRLGKTFDCKIGTMIEVPRAALTADEIATSADFFSFGTNDLTQMTLGFSRDDASKFLSSYIDADIYQQDPFKSIDVDGVGAMVKMAVDKARVVNEHIKLGVCGEHGGDPKSIAFFNDIGLHYVSCSPYRVPIARLAAAQSRA